MKLAVISDIHLGAGDRTDAFGHDDAEFLRFLDHLEDNVERIVLLGDIWETLTSRRLGDHVAAFRAAQEAHPEIARRFDGPRYSYVHGNHDMVAADVLGAPEELAIEADGTRLLFTHGHHHDAVIRDARWFAEATMWFGGWVQRMYLSPLYRMATVVDYIRAGVTRNPDTCPFQHWAMSIANRREADVIVTGHTHVATRGEHGARLFLNSGSCAEGCFSYLTIDTRAGEYRVNSSW